MADFSFGDLASQYASARLKPYTDLYNDPQAAITNRVYGDLGLNAPDQTGNIRPKSTTVAYNDDGTHSYTHKFDVAPVDYSLFGGSPQPAEQTRSFAPQVQQQPAQPAPQPAGPQVQYVTQATPPQQPVQQPPVQQAPVQQAPVQQPVVPNSMNGMPQTPGAGMFPAGAQPIPTNGATPQLTNAIAQIESNGNPNAVGAAGELGSMQALPSTMKDPGFGVKPAQDNTPAEADRVGRDYYSAMKGRYNDPVLAAAAYNAGPGRMDAAIARSQKEGGHPMQYMPHSTQQYAANFAQKINYQPGQTAEQNPNIDRPWDNPAEGLHLPGQETHRFVNMVNEAKGNPEQLHKIMYDPATPPGVARAAQDDMLDHLTQIRQVDQANQTIQKMAAGDTRATNDFVRETKKPSEEGSILKAIFYARMGLTGMAQEEQQKLLGQQLTTSTGMMDGQHYTLRTDNRGNIQRAYDAEGRAVDDKTLAGLQANRIGKVTVGGEYFQDKSGNTYRSAVDQSGNAYALNITNGQKYTGSAPLERVRDVAAINKIETTTTEMGKRGEQRNVTNLKFAGPLAYTKAGAGYIGKFNAENGTNLGYNAQGVLTDHNTGATVTPGANGTISTTINNVSATPTTPSEAAPISAPYNPKVESPAQYKERLKREGATAGAVAKKSAETVANAGMVADTIDNAQHAIDLLDSGVHNISPYGPRIQKFEQYIPGEVPPAVTNTKTIMDMVRSIGGAASQAAIKGHLTNQELTFLTENKPDGTDPKYTKQWLEKSIKTLRRAQEQAQAQVNTGGTAANPVLNTAPRGSRENPIKLD